MYEKHPLRIGFQNQFYILNLELDTSQLVSVGSHNYLGSLFNYGYNETEIFPVDHESRLWLKATKIFNAPVYALTTPRLSEC